MIRRRDVLFGVSASAAAVAVAVRAGSQPSPTAKTGAAGSLDKRRAQYQANSPEVQTFYRVNRYPVK